MKKLLHVLLVTVMLISLAACGSSDSSNEPDNSSTVPATTDVTEETDTNSAETTNTEKPEEVLTLKLGDLLAKDSVMVKCSSYFAQQIEELSDGKIKVEHYVGGVLGDDVAHQEALMTGALDFTRIEFTTMSNYNIEKIKATALPYVIRDRDHYWNVAHSEVGKELLDSIQESGIGMIALGYMDEGSRNFFMREEFDSIDDLKGKKIRVQNTEMWVGLVEALGASATPMSLSELYTSCHQGVVDGAENSYVSYESFKLYEVCPYMIMDGHVYPMNAMAVSEITWNKLTDDQKAIIMEAIKRLEEYNREIVVELEKEIRSNLEANGVTFIEVPDKTVWQEAVAPLYKKYASDVVNDILAKIAAIN